MFMWKKHKAFGYLKVLSNVWLLPDKKLVGKMWKDSAGPI